MPSSSHELDGWGCAEAVEGEVSAENARAARRGLEELSRRAGGEVWRRGRGGRQAGRVLAFWSWRLATAIFTCQTGRASLMHALDGFQAQVLDW